MSSAFFIYHFKDGIYWLLSDLSLDDQRMSWTGFHPYIFTDSEEVNLAADIIRNVMKDEQIHVAHLSLLSDFIESNASMEVFV